MLWITHQIFQHLLQISNANENVFFDTIIASISIKPRPDLQYIVPSGFQIKRVLVN